MTRVTLEFQGMNELRAALAEFGDEIERELDKAVQATGLELRGDVVKRIQRGPKTGRVYGTHRASAPGEAPATDTGRLASGVDYKKEGRLSASVGSAVAYAAMLEFGTRHIAPRPAWVPATEALREKFNARVEAVLARAMK